MKGEYRAIKKIICPKCKTPYPRIVDYYVGHTVSFSPEDDGSYAEGYLDVSDVEKTLAECMKCKHKWTLRKRTSSDIIDMHDKLKGDSHGN